MAVRTYLPETDMGLLTWSKNLRENLSRDPLRWGIPAAIWFAFAEAQSAYAAAYAVAIEPLTRTRGAVAAKRTTSKALRKASHNVVGILRAQSHITTADFVSMGITVPKRKSRIPAPDHAPILFLEPLWTRTFRLHLRDATRLGRARPDGVGAAMIFLHYGPTEPTSPDQWKYHRQVTRTNVTIEFRESNAFETVWIAARWMNRKGQGGPWSRVISINLPPSTIQPNVHVRAHVAA